VRYSHSGTQLPLTVSLTVCGSLGTGKSLSFVRPPQNMRALESLEYKRVWDEFDRRFTFRPSVDSFPGIEEPNDSITFRFVEIDDESMLEELQSSILGALKACSAFAHEVYYLDW